MAKLSDIVNPLYREYSPVFQQRGVSLDLDLENPTLEVAEPVTVEFELKKYLEFLLSKAVKQGNITISSHHNQLIIRDNTIILSPEQIQQLTSDITSVKSRLGFGTTISINL